MIDELPPGSVDALLDAAEDGVDLDGLVVERDDAGIRFAVPDAGYEGLDEAGLRDRASEHAPYVANWYVWHEHAPAADDRRAFLRWLEGADDRDAAEQLERLAGEGVSETWGQLHVRVRLAPDGDGRRTYELVHVDDLVPEDGAVSDDFETYEDPRAARELTKYDDRDRYRPLSTAPSLQTGWRFPALDAGELVEAVEWFYPATVANWHRERSGELDVDHWTETAERQTGIYDVIEELPREAVEWVAEACCVDSQCLRRREWQYDEGDEIDVDGGDGPFPCREPCSLVIAAARQWTILEDETERTYEFTLTPSEKNQLEALVDAVADGRTDEIREADVYEGANRYRARYLRAKRFDEEGSFGREVERAPDESGE